MVDCRREEALVPVERREPQLPRERMHSTGNGRRLQQCQISSSYLFIVRILSDRLLRLSHHLAVLILHSRHP